MPSSFGDETPDAPSQPSVARPPARAPAVVAAAGRIRRHALDPDAVAVVSRLQREGHEAYLVGGCVRDLLLGLEPKDFDVATDATPNRIKRLFRRAFVIGRRFRLVHVRFEDGKVIETSTFRADPGTRGASPEGPIWDDNVFGSASEDAFRRDFTVNALFYDPSRDVVVDHVGGLADLEARVVRAIGDPETRLREDPVRMIRALHFAARMGGSVEPRLLAAIRTCAGEIAKASPSRLYIELVKVLTRGAARPTMLGLYELGVLRPWLPDLCDFLDRPLEWPEDAGGTHEEARAGEPEDTPAPHLTWNLLGAADAWGMAPRGVPDGLALATLVGPWILETYERGPRKAHDLPTHVEETFRPLALQMSVPRRVSWEIREILSLLHALAHPPDAKRRTRWVVLRPAFPEALAFYGLVLRARDSDPAPAERWREIADEVWAHEDARRRARFAPAPESDGDDDGASVRVVEDGGAAGEDEGDPRPRRRRGRRGRGGGGRSREEGAPPADREPAGREAPRAEASPPAASRADAPATSPAPPPPRPPPRPAPVAPAKAPPPPPARTSASERPFGAGLV